MEKKPLVSVVIPCFNHEQYIEASIRSVYEQSYPNIDVFVVNDGSTDKSLTIIQKLQSELGFHLIDQANQGLTRAIYNGFVVSQGEFFISFDADDVMLPFRVQRQVEYMLNHPRAGACGANFAYIDAAGNPIAGAAKKVKGSYIFADVFGETGVWLGAPTSMYRRKAILDAGGYDLKNRIQDQPMELQVAHAGYTLDIIEDVVTLYRQHGSNMSLNVKKNYPFYRMAIDRFASDPGYLVAKRGLINSTLKWAVVHDKKFARELFKQLPFYRWNAKTLRRLRQYFSK